MGIEAKVIADSISDRGIRITTFQIRYPRFIHAEFMTHRVFSRNASSSRAIPVKRAIENIRMEPAVPIHWGINQAGMQAHNEADQALRNQGLDVWQEACESACEFAEKLNELGFHKQIVNRITEPFQHINVVVTATQWSNFFALRRHKDAQPEIKRLADRMYEAQKKSTPTHLKPGQWHLPYVSTAEYADYNTDEDGLEILKKVSAARCARVSYKTFDGRASTVEEDLKLCDKLIGGVPLHASPFEHQATPDSWIISPLYGIENILLYDNADMHGNLYGWLQFRKTLDGECQ